MLRVGILSDTHGLLRPSVLHRLQGCDRILHAGDVGSGEVLRRLEEVAPVEAIRGNTDVSSEVSRLPFTLSGELAGLPYRMVHRRDDVEQAWLTQARLVIYGHSHRPELSWQGECLLLNPGAVGARRFRLPLTLAVITVDGQRLVPEILSVNDD